MLGFERRAYRREMTGTLLKTFQTGGQGVHEHGLVFAPDGRYLLTGEEGPTLAGVRTGVIGVWQVPAGAAARKRDLPGLVSAVAWSPDRRAIATAFARPAAGSSDWDANITLWDVTTLRPLQEIVLPRWRPRSLCFSPDGNFLALGGGKGQDGQVVAYSVRTGQRAGEPLTHGSLVWSLAYLPDGHRLLTGAGASEGNGWHDCTLRLWDLARGKTLWEGKRPYATAQSRAAVSPDGKRIACGDGPEGDVLLWRLGESGDRPQRLTGGHGSTVYATAFSPDGKWLLSGSKDGTGRVWDVETGAPLAFLKGGHNAAVHEVAFSPAEPLAVTADNNGYISLWRIRG